MSLQRCLCGSTLAVMPAEPTPSTSSATPSPAPPPSGPSAHVPADEVTPSPTALRALAHPLRLRMLGLLRVDQTQQAELPKVSVWGGQPPKFDVQTAKVNVGTTQTTIDVPKVETEKRAIDLPKVSVDKPGQ